MYKIVAVVVAVFASGMISNGGAEACQMRYWHDHAAHPYYWRMSRKAYAQWQEFGLFTGSWRERHRIVGRYPRHGVVVKVWRPGSPVRCR